MKKTNLISDGDFEIGQGPWMFTSYGSGVKTEEEVITNTYCKIASTESVYQNIGIKIGSDYSLSFDTCGEISGIVSIMLSNSDTVYWTRDFNKQYSESWIEEFATFTPDITWTGPFMIHFSAVWDSIPNSTVNIDNIILTNTISA